jgi:hypothetical protein
MIGFIQVTGPGEQTIWINLANVTSITLDGDVTRIRLGTDVVYATDTPEEIFDRVRAAMEN